VTVATAPDTAAAAWRNRIVGQGEEAPDKLLANPKNWRIHPAAQQEALGSVLDTVGWVGQVLVNRGTGLVVDGHLRVSLALERHEATVPVLYVDLTPEEEALVLTSLDPISAMAGTDDDKLRELLADVEFDSAELEAHVVSFLAKNRTTGKTDPDDVPDEPTEGPYVEVGDLWVLGDHRLICGDSTDAAALDRLFAGETADCVWTDPPYGVEYVGKTAAALEISNDGDAAAVIAEQALRLAIAHVVQGGGALHGLPGRAANG
jgi:hypothetical protein